MVSGKIVPPGICIEQSSDSNCLYDKCERTNNDWIWLWDINCENETYGRYTNFTEGEPICDSIIDEDTHHHLTQCQIIDQNGAITNDGRRCCVKEQGQMNISSNGTITHNNKTYKMLLPTQYIKGVRREQIPQPPDGPMLTDLQILNYIDTHENDRDYVGFYVYSYINENNKVEYRRDALYRKFGWKIWGGEEEFRVGATQPPLPEEGIGKVLQVEQIFYNVTPGDETNLTGSIKESIRHVFREGHWPSTFLRGISSTHERARASRNRQDQLAYTENINQLTGRNIQGSLSESSESTESNDSTDELIDFESIKETIIQYWWVGAIFIGIIVFILIIRYTSGEGNKDSHKASKKS